MSPVFLETSALADLFFKGEEGRQRVEAFIPDGVSKQTSQYVLFELSRGFLRYLIVLHNKCVVLKKFSDLVRYWSRNSRKHYYVGAIAEQFTKYFAEGRIKGVFQIPPGVDPDEYELLCFRTILRKDLKVGWQKLKRAFPSPINDIGCRSPIPGPTMDENDTFDQRLEKTKCGIASACGLKSYFQKHRLVIERLEAHLKQLDAPDPETKRRIKALHQLVRHTRDFDRDLCWNAGDAVILHECPADYTLLTKNGIHYTEMAPVLNKIVKVVNHV